MSAAAEQRAFAIGDVVYHRTLGRGVVIGYGKSKSSIFVRMDDGTDRQIIDPLGTYLSSTPFENSSRSGAAIGSSSWADPIDLWEEYDPPELPTRLLPPIIAQFATVQGALMGADPAGLAMAALTACAAAIPDKIRVKVKRNDSQWHESARIWTALIGRPSVKKSPIVSAAMRPIRRIDLDLHNAWEKRHAAYAALPAEEKRLVSPPKQERLLLQDVTPEAAQEIFLNSPNGLLVLQDELSGWFGAMDAYNPKGGGAKNRAFWLESFNGGAHNVNRVGRGSFVIPNLSASIIGGIQPERIRDIAAESLDDGLLQRLLPIMLRPATAGHDDDVPNDIAEDYENLVIRLHALQPAALMMTGQFAGLPCDLHFDDEAQEAFRELGRVIAALQALEAIYPKLASHLAKLAGIFARLCVVWHCIENVDQPRLPATITGETGNNVLSFILEFLLPHAKAFYVGLLGMEEKHDDVLAVASYILAHPELLEVTLRDLQRNDRTGKRLANHGKLQQVFETLVLLWWLAPKDRTRNQTAPRYEVNPKVHQRFQERARTEVERRREVHELLVAMGGK